jgi:hypothetical protein
MSKGSPILLAIFLLLTAEAAYGQQHELGVLVGGVETGNRSIVPPDAGSVDISGAFALEVAFDQRLINAHVASLYLEVPVIVTPNTGLGSSNVLLPRSYSSVFVTPGLKLKMLPVGGVSPYVVLGGGLAHFSSSGATQNVPTNAGSTGATSAAYDFGGGVDLRVVPLVGVRIELRDISTGNPDFNVPVTGGRQRNLLIAAGVVLRF